jgi:hypothetical protein
MVRHWSRRSCSQGGSRPKCPVVFTDIIDLGFGIWRIEIIVDRSYLYHPWSRRFGPSSLPILMCRGQDGQVLGFGDQQGHSSLSRSFLWCLFVSVSYLASGIKIRADSQCTPHARRSLYSRSRCQCPSVGYAYTSQHFHSYRSYQYRCRCQNPGFGSTNHLWFDG